MNYSFGTITITEKAKRLIQEALDKGKVSSGNYVREFESKFAKLVGVKEAVALSTGTDADALALAVLYDFGAKRGDEIIVPALSFVATGNAVLQAGFTPVFVDVERKTLNIDCKKIEQAITPKTRAIMPVHLMGKPADMDPIMAIARKHKLYVVEDAAEAHGAKYRGATVGAIGDMGAFSLYVAHIISTIEGGIVTTNRADFADVLRSLRSHGRFCKCGQCVMNSGAVTCQKRFHNGKDLRFFFERIGFSAKMNELEAAVGLGNIDLYGDILNVRHKNLLYLIERFKKFEDVFFTIEEEEHEKIGPHAFPLVLQPNVKFTRDQVVEYFKANNIDSRNLFLSMPTQCPGFKFLGHRLGEFPQAEYLADQGIHIGIHQELTQDHLDYFLLVIEKFIKEKA